MGYLIPLFVDKVIVYNIVEKDFAQPNKVEGSATERQTIELQNVSDDMKEGGESVTENS